MKVILNEKRIFMRKVGGLGIDGVLVMIMLMYIVNFYCIFVYCVCYRLNFVVSQVCKNILLMVNFSNIISVIYNYICQFLQRLERLKDLNEIIREKNIKLKKIYEIYWFSMGDVVFVIIRNYEVFFFISEEVVFGDFIGVGLNK